MRTHYKDIIRTKTLYISLVRSLDCSDRLDGDMVSGYLTAVLALTLLFTIIGVKLFYWSTKSWFWGMKCLSKHQDSQICVLKLNKYE